MAVDKKNIVLTDVTKPLAYKSGSHPIATNYPRRTSTASHASYIRGQMENCKQQSLTQKQVAAIKYKGGMYLEFSGEANYELATKSLENRQQGVRLLNVRTENGVVKATVYVPEGKENFFLKRINAYETETVASGNPKHNDLIGSIENIKLAMLEAFWTDVPEELPTAQKIRCEVWLRYDIKTRGKIIDTTPWDTVDKRVMEICSENGIEIEEKRILFPERIVKLINANREQLKLLLETCEYVTEIRRAEEPNLFFRELPISEQREWANDLLSRTTFEKSGVSVCLLDAGINASHPLINPATVAEHIQTIDESWGVADNPSYNGHGTEMAGVILYNDLKDALIDDTNINVSHELESVKILPSRGENLRELYGEVTQQAVSMAEIENPLANRVICMPVTTSEHPDKDGRPTSWSAAIDSITSGSEEEDVRRLFIVSAGNVEPYEFQNSQYPDPMINHPVDDPGQAWNAITVGGYTKNVEITDRRFNGFIPVAQKDSLAPFSSTSVSWPTNKWPVKPEVLFEAGNIVTNGSDYDTCEDLLLLTTGHRPQANFFSLMWGTSSASAQASWFCAKLMEEYPEFWPETIRGLMIHSAEWTPEMKTAFCEDETKKRSLRTLLRSCGYGIPNLNRAIQCADNSVNMIIQGELQPFNKKGMNEMHMHTLPWPKEVLRDLGNTKARLRVTLSYFIEPSPGEVGWKDRYRYPSCGLRFELNNSNQSLEAFTKSINKMMKQEDDSDEGTSGGARWYLGKNNRDSGSIHSDFIEADAVELCECMHLAVYPVGGWWKERTYLGKSENTVKYSLIVSISSPEAGVDLYTPIMTKIENPIEVTIPTR